MEPWQGTLRVLWLVQFLTTMAMNLGLTFVPFFLAEDPILRVEDESARVLYTGLIFAGPFFTTIFFTPFWGWVADRTGPKRQVVRACFGLAATQLLMAAARSPEQMVVIRLVQGMVSGVLAACLGLAALVAPQDRHGAAIATVQSATPVGQIFGPAFGGLLATFVGFRATYVVLGSLILVTGLIAWRLLRQDGFVPTESPNPFRALYQSARRVLTQSRLRQALGVLVCGQFAFTLAQGVFAIYAGIVIASWVQTHNAEPAWWNSGVVFTSLAMTLTGVTSFATAGWWGGMHDRGVRLVPVLGALLLAGSMLLLFACPTWWAVLLARVGVGAGVIALATQLATISQETAPAERSQMMALATALTYVGNLTGFLVGALLATWWTEVGNFALSTAVYALLAVMVVRFEYRAARNGQRTDAPS